MEIYFLSRQQTADFLGADDDGFIQRLTRCDLRARQCLSHYEYRQISVLSADEFTPDEKNKLMNCCREANRYFDGMPNIPWIFAKAQYEQGLPHTRGDVIFLSGLHDTPTLVHERVHIYQKRMPSLCREACRGYVQVSGTEELYRSNPDTDSRLWVKDGKMCGKFYNSKNPMSIHDCSQRALHPLEAQAYAWARRANFQ
jgi:hypothetical protein